MVLAGDLSSVLIEPGDLCDIVSSCRVSVE